MRNQLLGVLILLSAYSDNQVLQLTVQYRHLDCENFDCHLHELETSRIGKSKEESNT